MKREPFIILFRGFYIDILKNKTLNVVTRQQGKNQENRRDTYVSGVWWIIWMADHRSVWWNHIKLRCKVHK